MYQDRHFESLNSSLWQILVWFDPLWSSSRPNLCSNGFKLIVWSLKNREPGSYPVASLRSQVSDVDAVALSESFFSFSLGGSAPPTFRMLGGSVISRILVYHFSQFAVTIKKIISFISRYCWLKLGPRGPGSLGPWGAGLGPGVPGPLGPRRPRGPGTLAPWAPVLVSNISR